MKILKAFLSLFIYYLFYLTTIVNLLLLFAESETGKWEEPNTSRRKPNNEDSVGRPVCAPWKDFTSSESHNSISPASFPLLFLLLFNFSFSLSFSFSTSFSLFLLSSLSLHLGSVRTSTDPVSDQGNS